MVEVGVFSCAARPNSRSAPAARLSGNWAAATHQITGRARSARHGHYANQAAGPIEQLAPAFLLRVVRVFDLEPPDARVVRIGMSECVPLYPHSHTHKKIKWDP
jgi:hypothetical protein